MKLHLIMWNMDMVMFYVLNGQLGNLKEGVFLFIYLFFLCWEWKWDRKVELCLFFLQICFSMSLLWFIVSLGMQFWLEYDKKNVYWYWCNCLGVIRYVCFDFKCTLTKMVFGLLLWDYIWFFVVFMSLLGNWYMYLWI